MRFVKFALFCCVLATFSLPSPAGEGRTPLWEATTITSPGSYVLTRDLVGPGPLIDVDASDVHIDLNGFLVEVTDAAFGIDITNVDRVTIRNGTVRGGSRNLHASTVTDLRASEMVLDGASGDAVRLSNVERFRLDRLTITASGLDGIHITGSGARKLGYIENSTITGTGDHAIYSEVTSTLMVRDNEIRDFVGTAVRLDGCTACMIWGNRVMDHANVNANGITLALGSSTCTIAYNQVFGTRLGIALSESNHSLVLNNVSSDNTLHGIWSGGNSNEFRGNVVNNNTGNGLHLDPSATKCLYRDNRGYGNSNTPGCTGGGALPDLCDESPNSSAAGANVWN